MLSVKQGAQQQRMNDPEPASEKIAAAAVAAAGDTHPVMAENVDEIGRVSRQFDRESVTRIEFPSVTTDTTVMSVVEAEAVREGMTVIEVVIETGTESGIVVWIESGIVMWIEIDIGAELLTRKGTDYGTDGGHQNETEIIGHGTAVEKENVNGTVIVIENGNESGSETETETEMIIVVVVAVITLARVHDPGTGTEIAARIETDQGKEKGTVIVSVSERESEVETVTGNEVENDGQNRVPGLPLEGDPDPELAPTPTPVAPPTSSTSTDMSPQQAVAVGHLVDGSDHRISGLKDLTVMTGPGLGRLIDTSPAAAVQGHHERKNENAAANEDEVLVEVDDRGCMSVYMLMRWSVSALLCTTSWLIGVWCMIKRVSYKIIRK